MFTYLNTPTGQDLLRLDRTGSVIDHLSAPQVARQSVPVLPAVFDTVVTGARQAGQLLSAARLSLSSAVETLEAATPANANEALKDGWAVSATSLAGRLDAAFHEAGIKSLRTALLEAGGTPLGDVALVRKPPGRFTVAGSHPCFPTLPRHPNTLGGAWVDLGFNRARAFANGCRIASRPRWSGPLMATTVRGRQRYWLNPAGPHFWSSFARCSMCLTRQAARERGLPRRV